MTNDRIKGTAPQSEIKADKVSGNANPKPEGAVGAETGKDKTATGDVKGAPGGATKA